MVIDDVFAVIAEHTRREILQSLGAGDKAVGQLVEELGASQPTISKHLRVLREARLVNMRAEGQKRFYSLNPEPLRRILGWLETFDGVRPTLLDLAAEPAAGVDPSLALKPAAAALDGAGAGAGSGDGAGAGAEDGSRQQQLGRSVGRAANRAADLLANLPKFGRRKD